MRGSNPLSTEVRSVELTDTGARVDYAATWEFDAAPDWTYDARLDLSRADDDALTVVWAPSVVHPDLAEGETVEWTRRLPERASILDAAGDPIFTETPVVVVGVDPGRVADLSALAGTLASTLGISGDDVIASVSAAQAGQFVSLITLRRPDYDAVRASIIDLPGTVFREETKQLAPTARFALAVTRPGR